VLKGLIGIDFQEYSIENCAENKWLEEQADLVVNSILKNTYP